jgi:hypothetical protein
MRPAPVRADAVTLIRRVLSEEGADSGGAISFDQARVADTILKSRERELKMVERRKTLVPAAQVQAHISRAFVAFREVFRSLPGRHASAIAAELNVDASALEEAMSKAIAAELDGLEPPALRT